MDEKVLSANNLEYTYSAGKRQTKALKGINFSVNKGEIFGFIGPNGAGKTTTIKLFLGILIPTEGEVLVLGKNSLDPSSHMSIGYMPEIANYYKYLTPFELLMYYGGLFGLSVKVLKKRAMDLLDQVGLANEAKRLMGTFSKGMMQKVSFAQALVNDPDLLILDEPTSGLDPVSRMKMREVILALRERNKTIFFSSHELSEVELISNRIGILNKGELQAVGSTEEVLGAKGDRETLESYFLNIIGEKL